jgi:hypothetical protein
MTGSIASFVARVKLHPETKKGGAPGKAGGGKKKREEAQIEPLRSYTSKTAAEIGKSNATVKRAVHRGEKIANVADLAGTSLDKGEELDALAKLPEPAQRDLIQRAQAGERVTARHAAKLLRRSERERELASATEAAAQALGQKIYSLLYVDFPWRYCGRQRAGDRPAGVRAGCLKRPKRRRWRARRWSGVCGAPPEVGIPIGDSRRLP